MSKKQKLFCGECGTPVFDKVGDSCDTCSSKNIVQRDVCQKCDRLVQGCVCENSSLEKHITICGFCGYKYSLNLELCPSCFKSYNFELTFDICDGCGDVHSMKGILCEKCIEKKELEKDFFNLPMKASDRNNEEYIAIDDGIIIDRYEKFTLCPECKCEYQIDLNVCPKCSPLSKPPEPDIIKKKKSKKPDLFIQCVECGNLYKNVSETCTNCVIRENKFRKNRKIKNRKTINKKGSSVIHFAYWYANFSVIFMIIYLCLYIKSIYDGIYTHSYLWTAFAGLLGLSAAGNMLTLRNSFLCSFLILLHGLSFSHLNYLTWIWPIGFGLVVVFLNRKEFN